MRKYTTINWKKQLLWLLPPVLRKKGHYQWLYANLKPLEWVYDDTLEKMQHTGQVIYLEKILNEKFNPGKVYDPNYSVAEKQQNKLIYLNETLKPQLQFVYLHEEYINPGYESPKMYLNSEITATGADKRAPIYLANILDYTEIKYANFRIMIPDSLALDINTNPPSADQPLIQTSNKIYYKNHTDPEKHLVGGREVITMKFHELLYYFKLAGKTYETYLYKTAQS